VAEIFDENLFKQPPPPEDCPICFLALPLDPFQSNFSTCCGKPICNGCVCAIVSEGDVGLCPFCRMPEARSVEGIFKRVKKLMESGNTYASYDLAAAYAHGTMGIRQDWTKANELFLKAGELGYAGAYFDVGNSYNNGAGVEVDKKKAKYYWELAAMGGDMRARHNLGNMEARAGNNHRAWKHYTIAAKAGYRESLEMVKQGFMAGCATKDEYANILRTYQERQNETKSDTRDKAALISRQMIEEKEELFVCGYKY